MAMEFVRADSGTDAIIWLVLGVFWLIAQGIAKLRGGRRDAAARRRSLPGKSPSKRTEDSLRTDQRPAATRHLRPHASSPADSEPDEADSVWHGQATAQTAASKT